MKVQGHLSGVNRGQQLKTLRRHYLRHFKHWTVFISGLVCASIILSRWSLLIFVEAQGHLRSAGVKHYKPCDASFSAIVDSKAWCQHGFIIPGDTFYHMDCTHCTRQKSFVAINRLQPYRHRLSIHSRRSICLLGDSE